MCIGRVIIVLPFPPSRCRALGGARSGSPQLLSSHRGCCNEIRPRPSQGWSSGRRLRYPCAGERSRWAVAIQPDQLLRYKRVFLSDLLPCVRSSPLSLSDSQLLDASSPAFDQTTFYTLHMRKNHTADALSV